MEVSDQIIKVLDNLGQKFGIAVDWTQSNIMPYVQQLGQRIVNYELWTSIVWIVLSLILLISCIYAFKKFLPKAMSHDSGEYEIGIPMSMFSILGIIISIIVIVFQVFDIVTCLTLPEKIWMQYIQAYIQK